MGKSTSSVESKTMLKPWLWFVGFRQPVWKLSRGDHQPFIPFSFLEKLEMINEMAVAEWCFCFDPWRDPLVFSSLVKRANYHVLWRESLRSSLSWKQHRGWDHRGGKGAHKINPFFSVSVEQGTCDHILAPAGRSFTIPLIFLLNYVHCIITCISQAQWGLLMRERSAFPLTRCLLHQSIPQDFLKVFKVTKYVLYCFIFVIYVTTLNIYHALDINTLCLVQGNKIYMLINALTQPH